MVGLPRSGLRVCRPPTPAPVPPACPGLEPAPRRAAGQRAVSWALGSPASLKGCPGITPQPRVKRGQSPESRASNPGPAGQGPHCEPTVSLW